MTEMQVLEPRKPDARLDRVIKLAIMAVGGQGGGVLSGWIEALARSQGYAAQATSVAGVAQRTGATIYYIEMVKVAEGDSPVFSLAPAAGDVDILIAAEMMEAGRAIMRGFVTPDRTTLIASTHRALAVSEKTVPGDGIASVAEVRAAAEVAARKLVLADMEQAAIGAGSVISASLFGALSGAGVLPFERAAFEDAIRAGGRGVEASLRAFAAGFDAAQGGVVPVPQDRPQAEGAVLSVPARDRLAWAGLQARIAAMPDAVQDMATAGLNKVVDFQDCAYGADYLSRVEAMLARDDAARGWELSREAAKYIANAMAYDDIIRVADLKTRARRFDRIRAEMGADKDRLLHLTEFLHPRAEEIASMLPARLGARVEASPAWMARLDRWFNRGRRLRSDGVPGFLMLYWLGGLRGWRLRSRRHQVEMQHMASWLETAIGHVPDRYGMAVEILRCRRLIKGYSDTHARGLSKFDRVLEAARLVADRDDGPDWVARLRNAALQDEAGAALEGAIATVRSFAERPANG